MSNDTIRIAVRLTDKARAEFLNWVEGVKADRVSAQACLDEFEADLDNNQGHYELGRFYTASGNPATTRFAASEIVWEEVAA